MRYMHFGADTSYSHANLFLTSVSFARPHFTMFISYGNKCLVQKNVSASLGGKGSNDHTKMKSQNRLVRQNRKLLHRCGFRFSMQASEQTEISPQHQEHSFFQGDGGGLINGPSGEGRSHEWSLGVGRSLMSGFSYGGGLLRVGLGGWEDSCKWFQGSGVGLLGGPRGEGGLL